MKKFAQTSIPRDKNPAKRRFSALLSFVICQGLYRPFHLFKSFATLRLPAKKCGNNMMVTCSGFTLIELLVVVLIIGILAAVALPKYQVAVAKSRYSTIMSAVRNVYDQTKIFYMSNGVYPDNFKDAGMQPPAGFKYTQDGLVMHQGKMSVQWINHCVIGVIKAGSGNLGYQISSAGKISCMARPGDELGQKLCKSFTGKNSRDTFTNEFDYFLF